MIKCGIYKITSKIDDKFYIGSAKDIDVRWKDHLLRLRTNTHVNSFLQDVFNAYGKENLMFEIIELTAEKELMGREDYYLNVLKPFGRNGYNISWTGTGGDFKYHPEKERIYRDYLKNNVGERNPFYGKKHSLLTIEKMRIAASKRIRRKFKKCISENDISFIKEASLTINSVKGIVRFAKESGITLGRTKIKKVLQSNHIR
jgi:group I intron endonuclease